VHLTETCEADAPHLIVEVTTTSATTADGDIVGELHERLASQQMLPREHLMDAGYVDAEVLALSQKHYHVDVVGPAIPDLSWASKEAGRFDQSQFLIDWQAKQAVCPAGHTSRDWLQIPDRHGKPSLRVRFPLSVCRSCPLHAKCTSVAAKVLRLRPDEATNTALVQARKRQETPAFWKRYATRAGLKARLPRPCVRARCGAHAILGAKSSGFRHFSQRPP
jgi:transposase